MSTEIVPIESTQGVIGWRVVVNGSTATVLLGELPVPESVTVHQILHVARIKLAPVLPPKPLKRARSRTAKWTAKHDRALAVAQRHGLDVDLIVEALPQALATLADEWTQREFAKRTAHEITGLSVQDIEKIDDEYRDHSTVPHFDEHAQELAYAHPELNWDSSADCSLALWELLHEPLQRKPTRYVTATLERAAELATSNTRGQLTFSAWVDDSDEVPF